MTEPCCYAKDHGLPFHSSDCTSGYRCSRCKAPADQLDGSWRFDGLRLEHKCPDADPQSGHFAAEHVDDKEPRLPGCVCTYEPGDSACPVHPGAP